MSNMAFILFPDLPWEIRHHIWKAAVRPIAPGIHTFSLLEHDPEKDETGSLQKVIPSQQPRNSISYFGVIPETDENNKPNRSAYLWDAGLWTACKESRQVITDCLNMTYWEGKKRQLVTQYKINPSLVEDNLEEYAGIPTVILAPPTQGNSENWHLMMRPYQDAIKPTFEVMCNWLRRWSSKIQWDRIFDDIPFSDELKSYDSVKHMVVEFDSSWLLNWPDWTEHTFDDEMTPRNFVYSMIREIIDQHSNPFIWLIDRGEYEQDHYFELDGGKSDIFYDCDDEYVEVDCDDRYWYSGSNSAVHFIRDLDRLGDRPWSWRDCSWDTFEKTDRHLILEYAGIFDPQKFHVFSNIGVLRPRRLLNAKT